MKRVAGRIMAINRFMPQPGKAAATSPGSVSVDENDLSLDLGHYVGRANQAAQASPSPSTAAAAAEFSSIGCSEDIELSVMADLVAVPSSRSALNSAATDLDDGVPSRNSVSSTLAPRLQQYPDDLSEADVRCPSTYFQTPIIILQVHFSLQSNATSASESSNYTASLPLPRKTKLQHIFEEIYTTESNFIKCVLCAHRLFGCRCVCREFGNAEGRVLRAAESCC